jgi:hypothetical protein
MLGREHVKLKITSHSTRNNSEYPAKVSDTCLFLDLTGIAASMAASYIAGIHYAFYCYPWWRNFYLITVGIYYLIYNVKHSKLNPPHSYETISTVL